MVYHKAPFKRLCIRQHYYGVEIPRTLGISRDTFRDPETIQAYPFGRPITTIHQEQHSGRFLHMCRPGSQVFKKGYGPNTPCCALQFDPAVYSDL